MFQCLTHGMVTMGTMLWYGVLCCGGVTPAGSTVHQAGATSKSFVPVDMASDDCLAMRAVVVVKRAIVCMPHIPQVLPS